ncbi:MAG TPA: CPBP family intramembrane glutamic endopeptidase [Gemmatimonadales bacterium]|nr:CPBP family intramembrane glutamic endopeptidase [Gemmatimonadales bacterium]
MTTTATAPARYWQLSQTPRYSLLFALPLFIGYEVLQLAVSGGPGGDIRNGADVILQSLFAELMGRRGPMVFEIALIVLGLALVAHDMRRHGRHLSRMVFFGMSLETLALAILCGVLVGGITSHLFGAMGLSIGQIERTPLPVRLMLSLGAGLYEELLFRVIIVGVLAWGGHRLLGWSARLSGIVAVTVGALAFSAVHYVGTYGDQLTLYSFVYRTLAGVFFSALYLLRGFGITAWTHALYDVFVLVA